MKYLLPLIVILLTFSLYSFATTPSTQIASNQIYQGYPCRDKCSDFQKGYDQAKSLQVVNSNNCSGQSSSETLGCQAYVTDYTYQNSPDFTIK